MTTCHFLRPAQRVLATVNKFALPYMIFSKVLGVSVLGLSVAGLQNGLDVSTLSSVTQAELMTASWSAAYATSGLLFPLCVYTTPYLASALAKLTGNTG